MVCFSFSLTSFFTHSLTGAFALPPVSCPRQLEEKRKIVFDCAVGPSIDASVWQVPQNWPFLVEVLLKDFFFLLSCGTFALALFSPYFPGGSTMQDVSWCSLNSPSIYFWSRSIVLVQNSWVGSLQAHSYFAGFPLSSWEDSWISLQSNLGSLDHSHTSPFFVLHRLSTRNLSWLEDTNLFAPPHLAIKQAQRLLQLGRIWLGDTMLVSPHGSESWGLECVSRSLTCNASKTKTNANSEESLGFFKKLIN